ncbi:MAG: sulfatase [Candidatus Binatia bacterium]|nr:sulfatase [Candidatus Binatia bacterium]MDG2008588.1 sulfatase [Candidatus Binatia bacterium]HAC81675.1 hypothetical protein [Deltaproteobacteria bacterium]
MPALLQNKPASDARISHGDRFGQGALTAIVLVTVVVVGAIGCDRLPLNLPTKTIEEETAVQARLWSSGVLAKGPPPAICEVDQVRRPALGCAESQRFFSGLMKSAIPGTLRIQAKRPRNLSTDYGLIETQIKLAESQNWGSIPPFAIGPETEVITQPIQSGVIRAKSHQAILTVRPLSSSLSRWRTLPLWPLESTVLNFDLAILPEALAAGARSARVRVFAHVAGSPRTLLFEKLIKATQPAVWHPQFVSLRAYAGQPTSLIFESQPWPPAPEGFSAPLIGAPMLTYRTQTRTQPKNIILISLDTLRGDQLGASVNGRALTPNLDAFGAQGAQFAQAMTTYPSTTASHMSMMTGLYPITHNTNHPGVSVADDIPMMAEILAGRGFATAAVTENAMLAASSGFSRGFDFYREVRDLGMSVAQGQIEKTFQSGIDWLEKHTDERFFLFLHTYQVHGPYAPPPEYDIFKGNFEGTKKGSYARRAIAQKNAYAGEVLYTDAVVGELLEKLKSLGLEENTLIIITSDHGEEFGDHGHIGHSQTPFESVMRIPLLIRAPGKIEPGRKVRSVVSLVDVLPTVLDLLDSTQGGAVFDTSVNAAPSPPFHGVSLVGLMQGKPGLSRQAVFAESRRPGHQSIVARTNTHRFITPQTQTETQQIFDLRVDATEQRNLKSPDLQAKGRLLAQRYKGLRSREMKPQAATQKTQSVDPETAAKLRALGYTDH